MKSEPLEHPDDSAGGGSGGDGADEDGQDNKDALHQELGFDASDSMGGDEENYADVDPSMLGPQSMEDVVAQALPGSSGFQGVSTYIVTFFMLASFI